MAKRERKRTVLPDEGIPMTPMIDVVFLILIYFVFTMEPIDIYAHLNVYTPSSDAPPKEKIDPPSLIRIGVYPDAYTFDDVPVTFNQLDGFLERLAKAKKDQSVLVQCGLGSRHGSLVRVLNSCAKYELRNLSVVSTN